MSVSNVTDVHLLFPKLYLSRLGTRFSVFTRLSHTLCITRLVRSLEVKLYHASVVVTASASVTREIARQSCLECSS